MEGTILQNRGGDAISFFPEKFFSGGETKTFLGRKIMVLHKGKGFLKFASLKTGGKRWVVGGRLICHFDGCNPSWFFVQLNSFNEAHSLSSCNFLLFNSSPNYIQSFHSILVLGFNT